MKGLLLNNEIRNELPMTLYWTLVESLFKGNPQLEPFAMPYAVQHKDTSFIIYLQNVLARNKLSLIIPTRLPAGLTSPCLPFEADETTDYHDLYLEIVKAHDGNFTAAIMYSHKNNMPTNISRISIPGARGLQTASNLSLLWAFKTQEQNAKSTL